WFIINQQSVHSLNFSALPISVAPVNNDYKGWLNLYKFLDFKNSYPEPESFSIRSILELAKDDTKTKDQIFDQIVGLTQWNKNDLKGFDSGFQLKHAIGNLDYAEA